MRCAPRLTARRALSWLTCWSLLMLSAGCATPGPILRPELPPELAAPCEPGPGYPEGAVPLAELLDVVAQREAAAAECRSRHRGLVAAWPR